MTTIKEINDYIKENNIKDVTVSEDQILMTSVSIWAGDFPDNEDLDFDDEGRQTIKVCKVEYEDSTVLTRLYDMAELRTKTAKEFVDAVRV